MSAGPRDDRALRREALAARASLQRLQLAVAAERLRGPSAGGWGALALRAAGTFGGARRADVPLAARVRPWMVSGGVVVLRLLRHSPTARWLLAAAALGGAVWWVARSLDAPAQPPDDSG